MNNFRKKMLELRPEIAAREAKFRDKIDLAMELRALRDTANPTQEQIASLAELSLEDVQLCEDLTGEMPASKNVSAYRSAVHAYKSVG